METALPPGPRLPSVLQTLLYVRWRGRFLAAMSRRYGDAFTLRLLPPLAARLVVFSRPEHVREIFAAHPAELHAGEGNRILEPIMGPHSVLITDEDEHARARRLLMPAFTGAALAGYRDMVGEIAQAHLGSWTPGSTVRTLDRMNDLTLDVILRVVFGVADDRRRAELTPRVREIVNIDPLMFFGRRVPWLRRRGPWKRFEDNQDRLDELLYQEIARRRANPGSGTHTDVLSRLLAAGSGDDTADTALTDEELRDQLITLLLAGHETTAAALAWTCHELAAHPEVQDRARAAVRAGDDRYLEAVLKESMRRHPVIGAAVRRLTGPRTLAGWTLPAGTVVAASILLAHQRPDSHSRPGDFRPERFLAGEVAPNTWFPFGGGIRRCLGAGFSLMEGVVVLRELLTRYTLTLPPGTSAERVHIRNITQVPAGGASVLVG